MRKLVQRLAAAVLSLVLVGCAVGPDYRRPAVEIPRSWSIEEKDARDLADTAWWEQLNDPVLNDLVAAALRGNKDVKIAAARIEEFSGRLSVSRGALLPQVGAGASAGREGLSRKGLPPIPSTSPTVGSLYQSSAAASWEIDLFGKLRRATEAARSDLLATEEGKRATILSLVGSVVGEYVNLRDLDQQLEIARRTVQSREDSYRIFRLRFHGGLISELELNQAKSEYEQALSTVPALERAIAQQEHSLSALLGRNPGPIPRGAAIDRLGEPVVPAGLPSDLLERRPDIRRAEQELIAANARIGVARAQYFPSISLTGALGGTSTDLSALFGGPARIWSYFVPVSVPIFTGGIIAGQVKIAEAQREQLLLRYQKAIQDAFRDMEDALSDQLRTREQLDAQGRRVETLRNYARVARLRFDNGYTSYIEVLDAERSLFDAELAYLQTRGALYQALVNLYKAMGGGWVVKAEKTATGVGESAGSG
ncbi:MAG TPA: efflux transporter outer membrane subunit [Deferrimonas sp.]